MNKYSQGYLSEVLTKRANLIEIVLIAILISLGVNLIAGSLIIITGFPTYVHLLIGLGICFGTVLYLFFRIVVYKTQLRNYEGLFIYSTKDNKIIPIPRYRFSEDLEMYLDAAFIENKALKIIWDKEPLKALNDNDEETKKASEGSVSIIKEAAEYFVLDALSVHLTDYFDKQKSIKKNMTKLNRDDIPTALLRNRFLELFSKPKKDRLAFVEDALDSQTESIIYKESGEIYQEFYLVLPGGSEITRVNDNEFKIHTKQFDMAVSINFEGFSALLPCGFAEHYLSIDEFSPDIENYLIDIEIKASFKFRILFSSKGRAYYGWVDSFLDLLDKYISENEFFELIGWSSAITVLQSLGKKNRNKEIDNKP